MKLSRFITEKLYLLSTVLITGTGAIAAENPVSAQPAGPPGDAAAEATQNKHVAGELIIQFKDGATDKEIADALAQAGLKVKKHIQTQAMKDRGHHGITHVTTDLPVAEALAKLKGHAAVEYAEPNFIYTHQSTANDPYFNGGYLWGMYGDLSAPANAYGSQAAEAWNAGYTGSQSVYVGIIDEGIQYTHQDLAANIWTNPADTADGADNDGNGYADDLHGWNFVDNNNNIYDPAYDDHGTHVAGTIGAQGGNAVGVAGINWNVSIISGKFLGANGGTLADAVEAVDYFTSLKTRQKLNLVALNNSWGGGGYSQALHDAILRAAKAGILFVAAAGNGDANGNGLNNDATPNYPSNYDTRQGTSTESAASYDAVIAVAAIDANGNRAAFSNYGATKVHLGAPGVSIYSTLPNDTYGSYSGTSMATPHVTGAVALYASTHPGATADQIRTAILGSVTPTPSLAGITSTGGRLNLSSVVSPVQTAPVPSAPTGLSATAGQSTVAGSSVVNLKWTSPAGAQSCTVKRSTTLAGPFTVIASGITSGAYNDTVSANGNTYFYVVSAVNSSGASPDSASAAVKPATPAPKNLAATAASRTQINLSWADQSSDETGFKVEISTNNGYSYFQIGTVGSGVSSVSVTGAAPNTIYYFRLRAYNASGNTAYSNTTYARTLP